MARGRQMGRLKLETPPQAVREAYLREWPAKELVFQLGQFPQLTAAAWFDNQNPLEIEIGPGTGEYLCALAEERPSVNFLGIEASRKAIYQAVKQAAKARLGNIQFLRANAKLLYGLFPDDAWQAVYLHFPDPVHKAKDEKHRVFDTKFLDHVYRSLESGGKISVVSDNVAFFMEMLALAEKDKRFQKAHAARYVEGFTPSVKSRFQRAWERKGVDPRQFVLEKVG